MSLTVLHAHCICSAPPGTCLPPSSPKSSSVHAVAASDRTLAVSPGPPPPTPSLRGADLVPFFGRVAIGSWGGGVRSEVLHEDTPVGSDSSTGTVGPQPPTGGLGCFLRGAVPSPWALSPPCGRSPLSLSGDTLQKCSGASSLLLPLGGASEAGGPSELWWSRSLGLSWDHSPPSSAGERSEPLLCPLPDGGFLAAAAGVTELPLDWLFHSRACHPGNPKGLGSFAPAAGDEHQTCSLMCCRSPLRECAPLAFEPRSPWELSRSSPFLWESIFCLFLVLM